MNYPLNEEERERFEEIAAILEYDQGVARGDAERIAKEILYEETKSIRPI